MKSRSFWLVVFVSLIGAVVGNLAGMAFAEVLPLVARSVTMGIDPPVPLDLNVVKVTVGVSFHLSIAGAVGLLVALVLMLRR